MSLPYELVHPVLVTAATELADVIVDADAAVTDPDYCSGESLACYLGNPLSERHVMVDYLGNVVHVRRRGTFAGEHLTITYLPSWFYAVLRRHLPVDRADPLRPRNHEVCLSQPADLGRAVPLEITVAVVATTEPVGFSGRETRQVAYDIRPTEPAGLLAAAPPPPGAPEAAPGRLTRVHWIAPSLRLIAAPGIAVTTRFLYPTPGETFLTSSWEQIAALPGGTAVMVAARAADAAARAGVTMVSSCDQALAFQLERRQDTGSLPELGAIRRELGVSDVDLIASAGPRPSIRFEETTRPDGVDLDLFTSAFPLGAGLDLAGLTQGALPPGMPVPVRIRVDPGSPTDRFAYTICLIGEQRQPVDDPDQMSRTGPYFRLTVIRTESVGVYVDALFGGPGATQLRDIVEYRERIAPFGSVPVAITDHGDGVLVQQAGLPPRPLTAGDVVDALQLVIGLVPFPACQVLADLSDYATLLSYAASGKDLVGREMTGLDAAITLSGLLAPEILEPLVGELGRLVFVRGGVADRLGAALGAVDARALGETVQPLRALGGTP